MLNPMSLAGDGVVAIWNGIRPEGRADFYEWHNREHMPERVGIPGFLRGRRYRAVQADPEFFTLYETASTAVLTGADYLARLNAPTPWTRRATAFFTDTSRSVCRVAASFGTGAGGWIMTGRCELAENAEQAHLKAMKHALQQIALQPGIVGAHLCIADRAGSGIDTEERKGRPPPAVPGCVLLVEGGADRAALESACAQLALDQPVERGLYQLQHLLAK